MSGATSFVKGFASDPSAFITKMSAS